MNTPTQAMNTLRLEPSMYDDLAMCITENAHTPCTAKHYTQRIRQACHGMHKRISSDHLRYVLEACKRTVEDMPMCLYLHATDITEIVEPEIPLDARMINSLKKLVREQTNKLRLQELEQQQPNQNEINHATTPEGLERSADAITTTATEQVPPVQPDAS
ncbi:hypothetical protein ACW5WN_01355 [Aeromonas lacus]|uniref:hypothetical protein n=1 Tax=Aeromonas lacus TaxID=558884 RepID=UPI00051C0302|nr:hypothetical protein [Aeromonas lacus]